MKIVQEDLQVCEMVLGQDLVFVNAQRSERKKGNIRFRIQALE